jgi:peptidoglycan/xylan/chitin deacetylase (PgdA/CDA1 family)
LPDSSLQAPDGDLLPTGSIAQKRSTIETLIDRCKRLDPGARAEYVNRIAASSSAALPTQLMLTSDALFEMAAAGLEIGGHTAGHPVLAAIDTDTAAREIDAGARRIAEITGRRPRVFAYPNGRPVADYAAEHVAIVRASSFDFAFSTAMGYATTESDRFQLPRFTPWDRAPSKFAGRLWAHFLVPQRDRVG